MSRSDRCTRQEQQAYDRNFEFVMAIPKSPEGLLSHCRRSDRIIERGPLANSGRVEPTPPSHQRESECSPKQTGRGSRASAAWDWPGAGFVIMALALLLAPGCGQPIERSAGVQLLVTEAEIDPHAIFEIRFEEPIATGSMIGAEAKPSPLLIRPELAGRFVYTSGRSGQFTPMDPMPLGTEYELTLRPGLRRGDGQPARAELMRIVHTPPFKIVNCQGPIASTNASARPEFGLWFNAGVKASEIGFHAGFENSGGLRVPALVEQGIQDEKEIPTSVWVTPAQPLGVGPGWKLVLEPRLMSADGRLAIDHRFEAEIGDVMPFAMVTNAFHHIINSAPRLQLDFSKHLDRSVTNSYTNWVGIAPWPGGSPGRGMGGDIIALGPMAARNALCGERPAWPAGRGRSQVGSNAQSVHGRGAADRSAALFRRLCHGTVGERFASLSVAGRECEPGACAG